MQVVQSRKVLRLAKQIPTGGGGGGGGAYGDARRRMWQRWHDHRVADDVGILLEVVDLLGDDPFQLVFLDGRLAILHPHHIRVVHGVH